MLSSPLSIISGAWWGMTPFYVPCHQWKTSLGLGEVLGEDVAVSEEDSALILHRPNPQPSVFVQERFRSYSICAPG